jgi:redox-sensing transcriptional repressor
LGSCEHNHNIVTLPVETTENDPQDGPAGKKSERHVSVSTVERLSVYRKVLEELHHDGVEYVYSQQLADMVGVTPAQLRRDLASFGSFGNISRGYNVYQLTRTISRIFGTDNAQTVALFGVGDLGRSLLAYRGFEERGFHIGMVFDIDADKVGKVFAGRRCYALDDMEKVLTEFNVRVAVLTCRAPGLQQLVDRLANARITSILNFVPKRVTPAPGGYVESIDIAGKLEKLSFLSQNK